MRAFAGIAVVILLPTSLSAWEGLPFISARSPPASYCLPDPTESNGGSRPPNSPA